MEDYSKILNNRRIEKRIKLLAETARDCDESVAFVKKRDFLEERIEFTQRYFTYLNDLIHKNVQMH